MWVPGNLPPNLVFFIVVTKQVEDEAKRLEQILKIGKRFSSIEQRRNHEMLTTCQSDTL